MKQIIAASLLLLFPACGSSEEGGNNSGEPAAAPVEQTPSNLQDDPNNSVVPLTTPAAPVPSPTPVATTLPAAMQGRWGLVANDCDPKMAAAAKGLMTVSGDSLRFYESRGRITAARQVRAQALELDLAFTGEGQEWTRRETLTLADAGGTLIREEQPQQGQEPPGTYRYSKCPAGKETDA